MQFYRYKHLQDHRKPLAINQTKNRLEAVGFDHLLLGARFENFAFCIFPHFPAVIKGR